MLKMVSDSGEKLMVKRPSIDLISLIRLCRSGGIDLVRESRP
jgi:hypothetical protein